MILLNESMHYSGYKSLGLGCFCLNGWLTQLLIHEVSFEIPLLIFTNEDCKMELKARK